MTSRRFLLTLAATFAFVLSPTLRAENTSVYELRIYNTNEGKLPDLLKRFREHTCELFQRHGIENIGYWVPTEKADGAENTLIYIIKHPSREAAKSNWAAFQNDPEWQKARAASEENGKLLSKAPESIYMTPTDFSPEIKVSAGKPPRVFEIRTYRTPEGKLAALHARFKDHTIPLFKKHGIINVAYFTPTDKDKGSENTLIYLLAHPSKEAGEKAFSEFRKDPDWLKAKEASEKDGPLTLPQPEGVKSIFMAPTDFSPMK